VVKSANFASNRQEGATHPLSAFLSVSCSRDGKPRGDRLNDRLAADLRARRPGALEELLATFGREIQAVAYLVLHSQPDAEEVVIDTMVTAWRRGDTLRDPAALRTWLLRIATRHALSRRRRAAAPSTPLLPDDDRVVGDTAPPLERVALLQALAELPPHMRAAVALHYVADLTVDDVALALGRSRNTVKSQLRIGLERLRVLLDDGGR
jgi:RNA polymerase sigma-70 factor (ECF subfamily)